MGIRIHKILGYGLTDVKHKETRISDDRFNLESKIFDDYDHLRLKEYKKWLLKQKFGEEDWNYKYEYPFIKDVKDFALNDCFRYDGEFGKPNVFVITPVMFVKQWIRYDDVIDYYEDSNRKGPRNKVKMISGGIYPYIACYVDSRTGKRIKDGHYYRHVKLCGNSHLLDKIAAGLGFKDRDECDKYLVEQVPESIELLCKFCKVFKDENTIWQLKPMLYTWWG